MDEQDKGESGPPPDAEELLRRAFSAAALQRARALREKLQRKMQELLGDDAGQAPNEHTPPPD